MALWRREAFERLPELRRKLQESKNPMAFWIDVHCELVREYEKLDDDFIRRVYGYAFWCLDEAPQNDAIQQDPYTAVVVCFLEHLPTDDAARKDAHRWMSRARMERMKSVFLHLGTEEQYQEMLGSDTPLRRKR